MQCVSGLLNHLFVEGGYGVAEEVWVLCWCSKRWKGSCVQLPMRQIWFGADGLWDANHGWIPSYEVDKRARKASHPTTRANSSFNCKYAPLYQRKMLRIRNGRLLYKTNLQARHSNAAATTYVPLSLKPHPKQKKNAAFFVRSIGSVQVWLLQP